MPIECASFCRPSFPTWRAAELFVGLLCCAPTGLQTQSATHPVYAGPFDAMKKIFTQHGIAGIYKGQVGTLWREATGYGIYFWAYEKLMQREMQKKGIRRDQVNPANAVLFGAAAGYAVSSSSVTFPVPMLLSCRFLISHVH